VLGFDVATTTFETVLGQMKYPEQEYFVNDHGLILNEDRAFEFRELALDRLGREEVLWVYALYALDV
jgi:hypothetical protein